MSDLHYDHQTAAADPDEFPICTDCRRLASKCVCTVNDLVFDRMRDESNDLAIWLNEQENSDAQLDVDAYDDIIAPPWRESRDRIESKIW